MKIDLFLHIDFDMLNSLIYQILLPLKLGKYIFWNLESSPIPNSCLLLVKALLFGFWEAIIPNFGLLDIFWALFLMIQNLKPYYQELVGYIQKLLLIPN